MGRQEIVEKAFEVSPRTDGEIVGQTTGCTLGQRLSERGSDDKWNTGIEWWTEAMYDTVAVNTVVKNRVSAF